MITVVLSHACMAELAQSLGMISGNIENICFIFKQITYYLLKKQLFFFFSCACTVGYKGKQCQEMEFCQVQDCPTGSECRNLNYGYECVANITLHDPIKVTSVLMIMIRFYKLYIQNLQY